MRSAALSMNEIWANRALASLGVHTQRHDAQAAHIQVVVDSLQIKHHGAETKYRPYLHVTGELRLIELETALPGGITEIGFATGQGDRVDAYYEFDDQQLVELAAKGYFTSEFDVPTRVIGIPWELPARVDVLVVEPEALGDPAVLFAKVHDIADLRIDLETSGYDLTEYFVAVAPEHEQVEAIGQGIDAQNLIDFDTIARSDVTAPAAPVPGPSVTSTSARQHDSREIDHGEDDLTQTLRGIEQDVEREAEDHHKQLADTEGTVDHIYAQRVADVLREWDTDAVTAAHLAVSDQSSAEAAQAEPAGDFQPLDLGLDSAQDDGPGLG